LLNRLEILLDLGLDRAEIFSDSQLVVHQMKGEMQCMDGTLNEYRERCLEMMGHLKEVHISHVSRKENAIANMLAQQASGYCVEDGKFEVRVAPRVGNAMVHEIENEVDNDIKAGRVDWRTELMEYIKEPGKIKDRKVRRRALKYVVIDNMLYRRTLDGVLLKCLSEEEAKVAMGELHGGMCGTHESAHKMGWL
jgi:hypothetical protein